MLTYLGCLLLGIGLALAVGERREVRWAQARLLPATILVLLFFMGVGIGRDPDLPSKIARFGWNAGAVALLAVAGSIGAVAALLWAVGRGRR